MMFERKNNAKLTSLVPLVHFGSDVTGGGVMKKILMAPVPLIFGSGRVAWCVGCTLRFLFILGVATLAWHVAVFADTLSPVVPSNQVSESTPTAAESKDALDRSATLCEPKEVIVFSCSLPKKKIVSLCASKDASNTAGYMQYRFGRDISSIELEYPKEKALPKDFFKYYSSSFAKGGTFAISFWSGEYRYSLFSTSSAFGYNGSGVILNRGRDAIRVSFLRCIAKPVIYNEMRSPIPFFGLQRLGLPDAGGDISYIGAEPGSDLDQPKQGEPEDWRLRSKH